MFLNYENKAVEGRIERLQVVRSDGSVRMERKVNKHNTIVNTGLDNMLSIGGFDEDGVSSSTLDLRTQTNSAYCGTQYDANFWVRLTYFMQIGTGVGETSYEDTGLINAYTTANDETYSRSHYIPVTADKTLRGTTMNSQVPGNISCTHRITSNSVKATEDGVVITEVGFFTGINKTFNVAWNSQTYNVGDMFSRISLADLPVTLNTGERLVVTYAITEYVGDAASHIVINDLNLTDSKGNPYKVSDAEGNEYPLGAIARTMYCCGNDVGIRFGVAPTADHGYDVRMMQFFTSSESKGWTNSYYALGNYTVLFDNSVYATAAGTSVSSFETMSNNYGPLHNFLTFGLRDNFVQSSGTNARTTVDDYGFPTIEKRGGIVYVYANSVGRASSMSNPVPTTTSISSYVTHSNDEGAPLVQIEPYTRGNYYRDITYCVPTYYPNISLNTYSTALSSIDPSTCFDVKWILCKSMLFKLGYFKTPGNISTFVPSSFKKKCGQSMTLTFRESVGRYVDKQQSE